MKKSTSHIIDIKMFIFFSIIILTILVGVSQIELSVFAQSNYGLSNPRKDSDGYTVYDCVYFGRYWQTDTNKDGVANKNDKKSLIKWRVLSIKGNDAFLVADQVLDVQRYHDDGNFDVIWQNSTMRSWLNGYDSSYNLCQKDYTKKNAFIDNAFQTVDKVALESTLQCHFSLFIDIIPYFQK